MTPGLVDVVETAKRVEAVPIVEVNRLLVSQPAVQGGWRFVELMGQWIPVHRLGHPAPPFSLYAHAYHPLRTPFQRTGRRRGFAMAAARLFRLDPACCRAPPRAAWRRPGRRVTTAARA